MPSDTNLKWWEIGILYQIYVRSFQDTDGDGVGDLEGILSRLDYLAWLGVSIIWLTPVYPSPQCDFGYDITNYTGIDHRFGTLNTFERLVESLHARGMRIVMDLVPNHTSYEHPWFIESSRARDSKKREWYLWQSAEFEDQPPNNWYSEFGGSIWQWHAETGQYYLHTHLPEQPDLNWRNREVRNAIFDVMRFWLERGVDGFRIDAMTRLIKDAEYRNDPPNPRYRLGMPPWRSQSAVWSMNQPEVHSVIADMRAITDEYDDRLLIGEDYLSVGRMVSFYGLDRPGVHFPFNYELMETPWDQHHLREVIDRYYATLGEKDWPNWVLSNHDRTRIATRIGSGQARVAALLMLTLRGTPTIYYGDELGMHDVPIPLDRCKDPRGLRQPGYGLGRDKCRTPMCWNGERHAGFSTAQPWLPIGEDYRWQNVECESADPHSMLTLYRRLIELRKSHQAFTSGTYIPIDSSPGTIAYMQESARQCYLVVANLLDEPTHCNLHVSGAQALRVLLQGAVVLSTSSHRNADPFKNSIPLEGNEGVVIQLDSSSHS